MPIPPSRSAACARSPRPVSAAATSSAPSPSSLICTPIAEYRVTGLRNRYRQPGLGVALAAKTQPLATATGVDDMVGPNVRVPATAVVTFADPRRQVFTDAVHGVLNVYAATDREDIRI